MIESARTQPIETVPESLDESPGPRREITRTVKIVMRRARSLPVAAALVMVAAAFIGGVILGELREAYDLAPAVVFGPGGTSLAAAAPGSEATPAAAVAAASAGFDLRVDPASARVVLDGRTIGVAPLRVRNLAPGEHVIELAADGYFARRLSIQLEANQHRQLQIELDRLEAEPEKAAAPEPKRRDGERRQRGKGMLKIGSKPPCKVVINGRSVGTTPETIELGAGRHSVALVNQTYAIRERIRVNIKPGETVKVIRDYSDTLESSAP